MSKENRPAPAINSINRELVRTFKAHTSERYNALDVYQQIATKSAIYPGQGTPLGLVYVALKGAGEAGEFAEHVGKAMRDDGLCNGLYVDGGAVQESGIPIKPERRIALIKEIGDQLWYLAAKCNELGITLSEAALINLEKLCDRTERDALRGSGDER